MMTEIAACLDSQFDSVPNDSLCVSALQTESVENLAEWKQQQQHQNEEMTSRGGARCLSSRPKALSCLCAGSACVCPARAVSGVWSLVSPGSGFTSPL